MVEYADEACRQPIVRNLKEETREFDNAVKAEQSGRDVLILYKAERPRRRLDGKKASYELVYRWLTNDDFHCVLGSEVTLWQRKELDFNKTLFEQVDLF